MFHLKGLNASILLRLSLLIELLKTFFTLFSYFLFIINSSFYSFLSYLFLFCRNLQIYEPPRYMSINTCIEQLLEIESLRGENVYTGSSCAFGVARLGQANQQIVSGTLSELSKIDFGGPLHSLVVAGAMHYIENEMYEYYHCKRSERAAIRQEAKRLEQEELLKKHEEFVLEKKANDERQKLFAAAKAAAAVEKQQRLDAVKQQSSPATVADEDEPALDPNVDLSLF